MITRTNWIFFKEIEWTEEIKQVHIDTRDFHASVIDEPSVNLPDLEVIKMYPERFFHTTEELKVMLERYYVDSGGKRDWRFLTVNGIDYWFKYIRILKTDHGWIVCNSDYRALNKDTLSAKVKKDNY